MGSMLAVCLAVGPKNAMSSAFDSAVCLCILGLEAWPPIMLVIKWVQSTLVTCEVQLVTLMRVWTMLPWSLVSLVTVSAPV
eukprot:602677-Ditylum_brightwellii.AAC.1